jgi:Zinc finger, C3HC4 type (RING finger)
MSPNKNNVYLMKGSDRGIAGNFLPKPRKIARVQSVQMISTNMRQSNTNIDNKMIGKISKDRYNKYMSEIMEKLDIKEKEDNSCLVCCELPSDTVFFPCYHGNICSLCALNHLSTHRNCLLCRAVIYDYFRK